MFDARAQIRDDGEVDLPLADDETFRRAAGLVEALAAHHGLSEVRLGQHGGELVVTVGASTSPAARRNVSSLANGRSTSPSPLICARASNMIYDSSSPHTPRRAMRVPQRGANSGHLGSAVITAGRSSRPAQ